MQKDTRPRVAPVAAPEVIDHRRTENQKIDSLGVLAAGIAHDFNNLLTGILGNASLLRADSRRGRHTDSYLAQIEETTLRAAELCKQMLAYAGQGQFTVRLVPLNTLITENLPQIDLGPGRKQAVQLQLASVLPAVRGDAAQLRQVLGNLLRNAAEAQPHKTSAHPPVSGQSPGKSPGRLRSAPIADPSAAPPSGVITITTAVRTLDADFLRRSHGNPDAQPGDYVALAVRDAGSGIPAPIQARMFEPFFSTKTYARGLGLSTVLGIVRAHGGVLSVDSEPGHGSTFTVFLPVGSDPHGGAKDPSASRF
jgi:signal transduction histidine kinase